VNQGWSRPLCRSAASSCAGLIAWAGAALAGDAPTVRPPAAVPAATGTVVVQESPAAAGPARTEAAGTPATNLPAAGVACPADPCAFDWTKVPPVVKMPRVGNFAPVPTGPGYYSFADWVTGNYREKPPFFPFPPFCINGNSAFDYDFRYLDKPDNQQHDWLDPVKRIHLGDDFLFSFGGEIRNRTMNEVDSRLTGRDNSYDLFRTRINGDLWYKDRFRIYAEFIYADSINQDLAPLPIDINRGDFLNLFVDLKLFDVADAPIYIRVGRQELLYGSQRLISPLDWADTRRTFEGVKGFWHSENLDIDAFWVEPVIISPNDFDSSNHREGFGGLWTTYRPTAGQNIDLYYLFLDQSNQVIRRPPPGERGGFDLNTLGTRYVGDKEHVLWDLEGMYQFGDFTGRTTSATAFTTGLGYNFADAPLNPTAWVYFDYASGDHSGGHGENGTFNQLFPFGHYYFGFIDDVGRQNIQDLNFHLYTNPAKWITTGIQYHMFWLDTTDDALYNSAGTAIRRDPTGRAGNHVGNELDLTTNFHLTNHQDLFIGYSKLFAGEFIKATGNPGSPELFYVQYSFRW
jgi:hypothetical protein